MTVSSTEARTRASETPEDIVDTLFRAVLRRAPGPNGRATYARLLAEGFSEIELVNLLSRCPEFAAQRLVPAGETKLKRFDEYRLADDPAIMKYVNPSLLSAVERLQIPSVNIQRFNRAVRKAIATTGGIETTYIKMHRQRFYELNCIIENLLTLLGENVAMLDFGMSINSFIMRTLFPNVALCVADRPGISVASKQFQRAYAVDLLDERLESIALDAQFDIIVFAEVIEHLVTHPTRVISFLLKHLTPRGRAIITTPNLFSRGKLRRISERRNPLPPYPVDYKKTDSPHVHVREYCMSELLSMIDEAGGDIEAFFFSGCWDPPALRDVTPEHERGNMCFIFVRRQ